MKAVYTKAEAEVIPLQPGRQSSLALEYGELELRYYAPKGVDTQEPHDRDEVYFVAAGSGVFFCDGRREAFQTGDSIFVPAYAVHRFESFTDDLAVWVVFFGPEGGSREREAAALQARQGEPPKQHYDPPAISPETGSDFSDGFGGDFGGK